MFNWTAKRTKKSATLDVVPVSRHGLWLFLDEDNLFVPYADYPQLQGLDLSQASQVTLSGDVLHWDKLALKLPLGQLNNYQSYPLLP